MGFSERNMISSGYRKTIILSVGGILMSTTWIHGLPETPSRKQRPRSILMKQADNAFVSTSQESSAGTVTAIANGSLYRKAPYLRNLQRQQRTQYYVNAIQKVALLNIFLNILGLDLDAPFWQLKLPRICWEACIYIVGKEISRQQHNQVIHKQHQAFANPVNGGGGGGLLQLLLAWMLASTALADIFVWGPIMAAFTSFQKCASTNAGWWKLIPVMLRNHPDTTTRVCETDYVQGIWGLTKTFQSIFGGLFYLAAALVLWNAYAFIHQDEQADQTIVAMDRFWDWQNKHNI